eukprot:6177304-Pleurochrysis_carterae.AAC.4
MVTRVCIHGCARLCLQGHARSPCVRCMSSHACACPCFKVTRTFSRTHPCRFRCRVRACACACRASRLAGCVAPGWCLWAKRDALVHESGVRGRSEKFALLCPWSGETARANFSPISRLSPC